MAYIVQPASVCNALDTASKLTSPKIDQGIYEQILAAGYQAVIRYVPLSGNDASGDIDGDELAAILDAGLGAMLVQHVYGDRKGDPWDPATKSAANNAAAAIECAQAAGYAPGAHIFVDLENISGTAQATIDYANTWAAAVVAAGYKAGCYIGFRVPLTAEQLWELHEINTYWAAPGAQPVARRGYATKQQTKPVVIAGVTFDTDTIAPDQKDETPCWMCTQPADALVG